MKLFEDGGFHQGKGTNNSCLQFAQPLSKFSSELLYSFFHSDSKEGGTDISVFFVFSPLFFPK
jgi:hypothetical protein